MEGARRRGEGAEDEDVAGRREGSGELRRMLRRALARVYGGGEPERPVREGVATVRRLGGVATGDAGVVAVTDAAA